MLFYLKRSKLIAAILYFILGVILLGASPKYKIQIRDSAGRDIELSAPVERAAVALRYNNELIRACGAIGQVIAVDMNTAQDREYWSTFNTEDVIGKNQRELNYEKIIELSPEVLILPANGAYKEAEKKLEPFGIKVIVISGYDTNNFHGQVKNIGIIFGRENEAEKFIEFYETPLKYIENKLKNIEKRRVYWEDVKNYYTSFPGSYYYSMVKFSGGENIFGDSSKKGNEAQIDAEAVISKNPYVIVKNVSPAEALKGTGIYHAPSEGQMKKIIEEIKNRKGWDEVEAVKSNQIYLMSQFGHGGASKMIGAVYMAKWIYPDLLQELDPDEIFRQWLEEFQGFKNIEGHFYPSLMEKSDEA